MRPFESEAERVYNTGMSKKKTPKAKKKRDIFVLDTNVLLYNPRAVFAFPGAEVVIPDQVLSELDKLKTSRADKELRFKGREIARILFDLSENGKLAEGIPFGDDSILRVISFNSHKAPEGLSGKSTDDRILGTVFRLQNEEPGRRVTIVTNDLNMLVKAQMLDIPVAHPGEEFAYGPVRRAFIWLGAQKRILAFMVAILSLIAFIVVFQSTFNLGKGNQVKLPPQLAAQLQDYQSKEYGYKMMLDRNQRDLQALIGMGNIKFDLGDIYQDPKYYLEAIDYYKKALVVDPKNANVRVDMAIEYTKLGKVDIAIEELKKALSYQPKHALAHYYLGSVLMESKRDLKGAREHFKQYLDLAPSGPEAQRAQIYIDQIDQALAQ